MAAGREILVVVSKDEDNSEGVTIPESVASLQDLQTLIEQTLFTDQLVTGSIHHLQILSLKFQKYKNLKSLEEIKDGNTINAVLKKQQMEPASAAPRDSPQAVLVEPPENGCKTCFTFDDEQEIGSATAAPQDQIGEEAGAIFPHNRLWNKKKLRVWFLNSIPPSWTYSGHKYPVPNGGPGHILHTSDILRLANNWSNKLPASIPLEQRECVPFFFEADSAINSDIRVWFQTKGGSSTKIGTAATKVPDATMFLNLGGDDRYKEHLVMHEFGHALGLGHEHQRKLFGKVIMKFFDDNVLKKKFSQYSRDVAAYSDDHKIYSEYDPDSIMHYWFDPRWLKPEYNTEHKVDKDSHLTPVERKVLKDLYKRKSQGLAEEISEIDHRFVAETYYNHFPKPEAPPNETDASGGAPDLDSELPSPDPTDNFIINSSDDKGKPLYFNTLYETACKEGQNKWQDIGTALNLATADLTSIAKNLMYQDPGDCFREMLNKWFQSNEECYLKDFISALKSNNVQLDHLVRQVKEAISARAKKIEKKAKRKRSSGHEQQGSKKPRPCV